MRIPFTAERSAAKAGPKNFGPATEVLSDDHTDKRRTIDTTTDDDRAAAANGRTSDEMSDYRGASEALCEIVGVSRIGNHDGICGTHGDHACTAGSAGTPPANADRALRGPPQPRGNSAATDCRPTVLREVLCS